MSFKVFQNPELDVEFELNLDDSDSTEYAWIDDEWGNTIHLTKEQFKWIANTFLGHLNF